jgi:predicted nucleotidyltransferase
MLTHERICYAIGKLAPQYSLTKATYFGSYAEGRATENSDLDLLVQFKDRAVDILEIIGLSQDLEELLSVPVEVIHEPIPEDSFLEIGKTVVAYEKK